MTGVELIADERKRQIEVEGWTPEHDDKHSNGELARAAACYASDELLYRKDEYANSVQYRDPWPEAWEQHRDKRPRHGNIVQPNNPFYMNRDERLRQLAKAGALIAAEIDRIQRRDAQK